MKRWDEVFNVDVDDCETMEIKGKSIKIPPPEKIPHENLVMREDIIEKALAAWMKLNRLPPMNFRLYGPPGGGKNSIVYLLTKLLNKSLYIMKVVDAFNPEEDVACTMVMYNGTPVYVAQPLLAAMIKGQVCLFDELDKTPEAALVPLSPVLDDRRTLYSTLFGNRFKAHEDFLFCAALSEEAEEGNTLPEYIRQRTSPAIYVGPPDPQTLERMLKSRLPEADDVWFQVFLRGFSQKELVPRVSLNLLSYAFRLFREAEKQKKVNGKVTENVVNRFLLMAQASKRKEEEKERYEKKEGERTKEVKNVAVPSIYQDIPQGKETFH